MVLALPFLLFITALMIDYGTVASWKVRSLSVAREAAFGSRLWHSTATDPPKAFWANAMTMNVSHPGNMAELNDPRADQPVVRGPLPQGATVDGDLLDPARGPLQGEADLERNFPLMRTLGKYRLEPRAPLLDDMWQFPAMGIPATIFRRIPFIYALATAPPTLVSQYVQAAMSLHNSPVKAQLAPLDHDPDYIRFSALLGWGGTAPDFHPWLFQFCSLDKQIADDSVQNLIDRIQGRKEPHVAGVPETMGWAFLNLYEAVVSRGTAAIKADQAAIRALQGQHGPGVAAQIAALQAQISQWQATIQQIQPYIPILTAFLKQF